MPNNKIIYGDRVLIDLTADTAAAETVLEGQTFHDKSGAPVTGSCTFDSDTQDATAAVAEILKGKTAYARGAKVAGTMINNGAVELELQSKDTPVTIPHGYHDGSGIVRMNSSDAAKLIPENIRQGVEILDVIGTMSGSEDVKSQAKEATPSDTDQTVLPDPGYNYLSQVKVKAIPYAEEANAAGGTTVTIG